MKNLKIVIITLETWFWLKHEASLQLHLLLSLIAIPVIDIWLYISPHYTKSILCLQQENYDDFDVATTEDKEEPVSHCSAVACGFALAKFCIHLLYAAIYNFFFKDRKIVIDLFGKTNVNKMQTIWIVDYKFDYLFHSVCL